MRELMIASYNEGKVSELRAGLEGLALKFTSAKAGHYAMPEETGVGFIENALIKARAIAKVSNLPTLADDSGLVVSALNGAPGVYSARYAGADATDEKNIQKLLRDMAGKTDRSAYFYCVLVLVRHALDPMPVIAEGQWFGTLLDEARGSHGFGYDPIFYIEEEGCTSAELEPVMKQRLSHRALALENLRVHLQTHAGVK